MTGNCANCRHHKWRYPSDVLVDCEKHAVEVTEDHSCGDWETDTGRCVTCRYVGFYAVKRRAGSTTLWWCEHPEQLHMSIAEVLNFSCSRFTEQSDTSYQRRRPAKRGQPR